MSCRVIGLDIETAAARGIVLKLAHAGARTVTGDIKPTLENAICRDLFERCGFAADGEGRWILKTKNLQWPAYPHVSVLTE
jgi:predicted enzyme involved in methoxymalonyl-ACP biosynthesis